MGARVGGVLNASVEGNGKWKEPVRSDWTERKFHDGCQKRRAEEHRRVEWLEENVLVGPAGWWLAVLSPVCEAKRFLRKFREHPPVRQTVAPRFPVVAVVRHAAEIQWLLFEFMADTIRQFHSHDDARILFHRSDDAEIDLFRESRRPQTFSLIVLKEPDPDSWDGEEEQQGETKRRQPWRWWSRKTQRQSREWCDRWCWWRDVIRMTRLFFLFVHQVIEKQGPDTDD